MPRCSGSGGRRLRRQRWARAIGGCAVGLVLSLTGAQVAAAGVRHAPVDDGGSGVSIVSGGHALKIHSVAWSLSVVAFEATSTKQVTVSVILTHALRSDAESHSWTISELPRKSLVAKGGGTYVLDPAKSYTSPLMSIDLTFTASSRKAVACASGSETTYTGHLAGKVVLATGLTKAGTVGATKLSFSKPNTTTVDNSCVTKTGNKPPCEKSSLVASFSLSGAGAPSAEAYTPKGQPDTLSISAYRQLAKPAHAFRYDAMTAEEPATTVSGSPPHAKVTTSGTFIAGHMTAIGSTSAPPQKQSCTLSGHTYSETTRIYVASQTSTLAAKSLLTGTLRSPRSGPAQILLTTYS
jgi:hypothetical protein